ncbi:MAG: GTP-binding protein [Deltaproteobacteria bacterium]|nr:GTP-binding protein [Deltaproteobacteria bacterium]
MDGIPVTVITGFLGAGKTTLLDQWLRTYRRGEVAVIVNEVGAVGVDGDVLRARVEALVEITGGCVCCSTYPELVKALTILAEKQPQRVFVETSGAASPAGVVRAVHASQDVWLDGIVTVVDATARPMNEPAFADLAAEQLGYADIVVLSNADRLSVDAVQAKSLLVAQANPTALIACADRGLVRGYDGPSTLLNARRTDVLRAVVPSRGHAGIQTLALQAEGELDEDRFGDWIENDLANFEGRLMRVKGVVAIEGIGTRIILQGVQSRLEVSQGEAWGEQPRASQLVIIGFALDEEELLRGFRACLA